MIKFIIGFFGWLAFIPWEVNRNYKIIEDLGEKPNYLENFAVRAFFGLIGLFLMRPAFDPGYPITWLEAWPALVFEISSFYLAFDPWLNIRRKKAWNHQGEDSGWLDKSPKWLYYSLKVLCVIGLVVSIVVLWKSR